MLLETSLSSVALVSSVTFDFCRMKGGIYFKGTGFRGSEEYCNCTSRKRKMCSLKHYNLNRQYLKVFLEYVEVTRSLVKTLLVLSMKS